jgi:RNA polymerase sigma factor (sigma-70 family)
MRRDQRPLESGYATMLRAAQCGDEEAMAELLAACRHAIRPAIKARVPRTDVEDVVQDVLLAVATALARLRSSDAAVFWRWVWRIMRCKIADHYRRADGLLPEAAAAMRADDDASCSVSVEEWLDAISLLNALPPRQQAVVILHVALGMPCGEVGRLLGMSEGAVRTMSQRAVLTLRRLSCNEYPSIPDYMSGTTESISR